MAILVTGSAGFIGFHVARALLDRGETVVGVDNLNDYYEVSLKEARLAQLQALDRFEFRKLDIADAAAVDGLFDAYSEIDRIIQLAAQAGVRYSLINPAAYVHSNLIGHFNIMEAARARENIMHLVFASSSSVYAGLTNPPFKITDATDTPISLYAATKKSGEAVCHSYAHLFDIPTTSLRFFTVYGPWGRPDMAAQIFPGKIVKGEPIDVFNNGDMRRDFTFIDDIVAGVVSALDRPPSRTEGKAPYAVYNLGNNRAENLMDFIKAIEDELGRKAEINFLPMQPGDVSETWADIDSTRRDLGYDPATPISEGVPKLIAWFREYYGV
ncbi:MAG: SDR family NAD(P)-dependent oxidoreductase [Rhodospirillaceae bacterium]